MTPEVGEASDRGGPSVRAGGRGLGVDLRGAQPTPGNIEGGLRTIEEKALGAAKKGGSASARRARVAPRGRAPGLYIMDTPGNDIEQMVGMVAGGCQLVAFTTGGEPQPARRWRRA